MWADTIRRSYHIVAAGGGAAPVHATTGFVTSYAPVTYDRAWPASGTSVSLYTGGSTDIQRPSMSFELWWYCGSGGGESSPIHLNHDNNTGQCVFGVEVYGTSGSSRYFDFYSRPSQLSSPSKMSFYTSSYGWAHVVGTCTSGAQKLYLNNVLKVTNTYTGNLAWTNNGGNINGPTYTSWSGDSVRLVKLYDYALSATEVSTKYAAGVPT